MQTIHDADPMEAQRVASDMIDELLSEGMTQADILGVLLAGIVIWAQDLEWWGNKGALHQSVRTQPEAIRAAAQRLIDLGDAFDQRRKRGGSQD